VKCISVSLKCDHFVLKHSQMGAEGSWLTAILGNNSLI